MVLVPAITPASDAVTARSPPSPGFGGGAARVVSVRGGWGGRGAGGGVGGADAVGTAGARGTIVNIDLCVDAASAVVHGTGASIMVCGVIDHVLCVRLGRLLLALVSR